jgi:hypothetical protein
MPTIACMQIKVTDMQMKVLPKIIKQFDSRKYCEKHQNHITFHVSCQKKNIKNLLSQDFFYEKIL